MAEAADEGAKVIAVGAHGMLNAVAAMVGAARMLERPGLPDELRCELTAMIVERGDLLAEVLRYVLDGLPPEARNTIDLLDVVDAMDVIDLRDSDVKA